MKKGTVLLACLLFFTFIISNAQNYQINTPDDDAEESAGYTIVTLNSPVIDLTADPTNPKNMKQIVGLRFTNVQLQKGTALSGCYLAFTVDQPSNKVTMLSITGEKKGNAQPFQAVNRNISSRPKTIARVNWNAVEPWVQAGETMRSPDISKILTEIISLPDWLPGNSIVLMIEGNGMRHATAYDKNPQMAVQLILNNGAIMASAPQAGAFPTSVNKSKPATHAPVTAPEKETQAPSGKQATPQSTSVSGDMKSGTSLQETINTSQSPATLGLDNQIQITIPQGVAPSGTKLTVNPVNTNYNYDEFKVVSAYDIKLSSGSTFKNPLEIKLFIDKNKMSGPLSKDNIRPVYFDESSNQWISYEEFSLNEQEPSIVFRTNHLTSVGFIEFLTTGLYTEKFENSDCVVYFTYLKPHKPMSNEEYNDDERESWHIPLGEKNSNEPYMIQDIAHWVSEVKKNFKASPNDLWVPSEKINVYVKNDPQADGEYGPYSGCLYINNTQTSPIKELTPPNIVKSLVAHEFLHLIQDHYYFMQTKGVSVWWFEAFATQGDVMAYGRENIIVPESERWAQSSSFVEGSLRKSWDAHNVSPDFYGCGLFLHYLANYRPGTKANLAVLMKEGGSNTDLSYYRTIVDNYLKDNLKTDIEKEFEDFVKWAYQNNESKIKLNHLVIDPNHTLLKISETFTSANVSESLPYLSAKIIKLRRFTKDPNDIKVETTVQAIGDGVKLFLCDLDLKTGAPKIVRELKVTAPDSSGMTWTTTTTLSTKYPYTNILAVNRNKDKNSSFSINVKNMVPPKN